MAFKFFTVPIADDGQAEVELNSFLNSHKILSIDRRWVEQGAASFWSFCIDYIKSSATSASRNQFANTRPKVDYKEVLGAEEFAVFAKLRDLRKEIAQSEAVPVYNRGGPSARCGLDTACLAIPQAR